MPWAWPIATGSDWNAMGWDAICNRAATRYPAIGEYDGMGTHSTPDDTDETEIQVGFTVHENEEVMVFKATDTVNVGDFIKVPI